MSSDVPWPYDHFVNLNTYGSPSWFRACNGYRRSGDNRSSWNNPACYGPRNTRPSHCMNFCEPEEVSSSCIRRIGNHWFLSWAYAIYASALEENTMSSAKLIFVIFIPYLLGACQSIAQVNSQASQEQQLQLSPSVRAVLDQHYTSYRTYNRNQFLEQIQRYTGIHSPKETPMAVEGDFNGDSKADMVVMIAGTRVGEKGTKTFLVFISSFQTSPNLLEIMDMNPLAANNIDVSLTLTPKSPVVVNGSTSAIQSEIFHFGSWGGTTRMYVIREGQLREAQYPQN